MTASRVTLRLADRRDDAGIRALLRRTPMPGEIALAFTHEPSFFDAVTVEGDDARVLVAEQDGRIDGLGVMAFRQEYLNGAPAEVGYLSSLRLDPALRGGLLLARGYRWLHDLHRRLARVPFYLSTIMEDNVAARELLTGGRAGLPAYTELAHYRTLAMPLLRCRTPHMRGVTMVTGETVGTEALVAFLRRVGPSRQCYPVYTPDDFAGGAGRLRGLSLRDVTVALSGDTMMGVLACWDQSAFRQHRVAAYAGLTRRLRPAVNALGRLLGGELLPEPGAPVRCVFGACLAVRDDDPAVCRALLRHVRHARAGQARFLFLGLAQGDLLLPAAEASLHLTLHSRLYAVHWDELPPLDGRVPYLELGSL